MRITNILILLFTILQFNIRVTNALQVTTELCGTI